MKKLLFAGSLICLLSACMDEGQDANSFKPYDGPTSETADIELLYSDSAVVVIKLEAPKQLDFENGDSEFPDGFYIEFYEKETREKSSTIAAKHGSYNKEKNLYTATGEVVVENLINKEKLETELLHWDVNKHEIYTDRYVEITTEDQLLMGEGLTADEAFSSYKILKPTGSFSIND